jgi:hypothetical protein
VNGKQRPPNRILRRIREVERQETREEFAESVVAAARAFGVEIACNYRTIARWEDGETAMLYPAYRRALSALLNRPLRELGFTGPDKGEGNESNPNEHIDPALVVMRMASSACIFTRQASWPALEAIACCN